MFDKIRQIKEQARAVKNMLKNEDAKMGSGTLGKIVGLGVGAILLGTIFIEGVRLLAAANTTNLTATEITLLGVLGLILFVGAVWLVLEYAGVV